jgi:hypothetical protein
MASDSVTAAKIGLIGAVLVAIIGLVPFIWSQLDDDGGGTPPTTSASTPVTTDRPDPITTPSITLGDVAVFLSKESGPGGATMNVSGEGFAGGERVEISMQTIQLAMTTANDAGGFSNVAVTVPERLSVFAPAQFEVTARGLRSLRFASAPFTVSG